MQRFCGANVRREELKSAAINPANHMKINFEASDGWLWPFCKRYGITNMSTYYGEALSAPAGEREQFRPKNKDQILQSQIYNADQTGLFWRSLPENIPKLRGTKCRHMRKKISKKRISTLLGKRWRFISIKANCCLQIASPKSPEKIV